MEISPNEGYNFRFNAMFDRCGHPAAGRDGGLAGAPGNVSLSDGTQLRPKGTQQVPAGARLVLEMPGGGGHGRPEDRDPESVARDVAYGYITVDEARDVYHHPVATTSAQ